MATTAERFQPAVPRENTATGQDMVRQHSQLPGQGKSGGQGDGVGRGPCFTCGAEGHFARNCPSHNGGKGQSSDQSQGGASPQPQQQQQQTSAGTQYEPRVQLIGQSAKKSTYLTVHWRGKQYNALLDTGCKRSVVGKRLLPSGMELSPPTNDLYAANRTKIPLIGCTTINFTVHGKEYSADLAVTNSVDELIFGIDWLMKNAAQWDFERGRIFLGGKWITLQQRVTADRVRWVYAMDTIRIPPLSPADVPVSVTWPTLHPTQSDWLVEPKAVGGELIVARTLVSGEALNTAIRVINVTDQEYTIHCDDELGKACQATVTLETVEERPKQEAETAASAGEMAVSEGTHSSHLDSLLNHLGDNLSSQQKDTVGQFIRKNADVFSASEFDLGCTGLLEHSIELNSNKPVRQALRRHPVAYLPLIDDYVDSMVENGIVEPIPGSEWMANIVLVRKKDGTLRYCVDY